MKKTFFLSIVLICIFVAFSGCSKAENSDNFKINKQDIDNRLLYNKITNSVNKEYLKDVFADNFETEYQSVALSENYDEVQSSLIEDIVILEYCKKQGIFIDRDSATELAKLELDNLNKDDSQNRYASILEHVLSEYKLSETDYLNLLCEQAYYKYNTQALQVYFDKNLYKENDNKTFDEQFQAYVETLLNEI